MSWKRILLFSILFSILVSSLLYYVLPKILFPLRKDTIPSGAYIIPWMKPNPSIEELRIYSVDSPPWDIDAVMTGALKLNITSKIDMFNETRVISSTVFFGHDTHYLYVGGKFRGMYRNPTSYSTVAYPNIFAILFDVANDGQLTFPESGTIIGVALFENAGWHTGAVWSPDDLLWSYSRTEKHMFWCLTEDYYWPNAQPPSAVKHMVVEYDNSTGTLIILFARYLRWPINSEINSFQMRSGECWIMGFLLELGYTKGDELFQNFMVSWPQREYSYLSNDSSLWPKLCIDLTNPAPEFK